MAVKTRKTVKAQVQELLDRLPNDCSLEDVQYELYLIEKVERGLTEVREGKGIPHDVARKRLKRWLAA